MSRFLRFFTLLIMLISFGCMHTSKDKPKSQPDNTPKWKPISMEYEAMGSAGVSIQAFDARSFAAVPMRHEAWNTDEFHESKPNIFHSPLNEPLSTFSIDVDSASYSMIRKFLNDDQLPAAGSVRTEEVINYFAYDYPQPQGEHPFSVYTELGSCPWEPNHQLVHIGLQGRQLDMQDAPAANLVFLLDTSGSMYEPNRLPLAKTAMKMLAQNLREQDRIAIVAYASRTGIELESTSGANKKQIMDAIDRQEAFGATSGGEGIKLAYQVAIQNMLRGGNNRVILCTDGDFNLGVSSTSELKKLVEKHRDMGISLTVLGFGMGNYKDSRLETLSSAGDGNYAYIDSEMEAKKVLVNEMSSTLYTIAKDVKLQVEFNPAHVKAYRLIGYENRLLNKEDFKDDKVDAQDMGAGHSVTALYEIIPADSFEEISGFEELRYQESKISEKAEQSAEIMNLKIRYKPPLSDSSILMQTPIYAKNFGLEDVSESFMWSAAAAGYAMLLQNSEDVGLLNWDLVFALAQKYKGSDSDGYRQEFIDLVKKAAKLNGEGLNW